MSKYLPTLPLVLSLFIGTAHAAEEAAPKADPVKGKEIAETVCAACHAADGNSVMAANPKLAGQHPEYLYKQMRNFKAEGDQPAERANPIMGGMVAGLSDEDMRNLAAYFAAQKQTGEEAKGSRESVDLGRKLWRAGDAAKGLPACAACHGPAGRGLPAQYPRLAGQFADYTEAQLQAFRRDERANDAAKMMRTIAAKMTDAEMKAVADYAAGLR